MYCSGDKRVTIFSIKESLLQGVPKQAEELKSCEMKEAWIKNDIWWIKNDEGWMKNGEGWMMKDDDFKLLRGLVDWRTDRQTSRHL